MIDEAAQGFLDGLGAPALAFPAEGTGYIGQVLSATTTQQTDINTGGGLTFGDGNPKMQLVVTLATGERLESIEGDDGERRWFTSFGAAKALKAALKAARTDLAEGVTIAVVFDSTDKPATKGLNGAKHYAVKVWATGETPDPDDVVGGVKVADLAQEPF